jgi:DMSO/TMAO reductase YedYZ molybdopterin-dependent catalytic subunit
MEETDVRRYGRRAFLGVVVAGVSALAWADRLGHHVGGGLKQLEALAPSRGWRIYTVADTMPTFDRASWRLRIDGLVERPLELSYEDLRALPRAQQTSDFHCVTGWTVHGVRWSGVRFHHLLEQVEPLPSAKAVRFVSLEQPYDDSLTLAQLRLPDVMLALDMDGEPLSRPHGSPARVVIPEMYGYKGVKWLSRIEFVAHQPTGYWEGLGYDQNAWVGRSNGYTST